MISDGMCKRYLIESTCRIISSSFSEKAELELLTGVTFDDYQIFMTNLWEPLVAANLRFVIDPYTKIGFV